MPFEIMRLANAPRSEWNVTSLIPASFAAGSKPRRCTFRCESGLTAPRREDRLVVALEWAAHLELAHIGHEVLRERKIPLPGLRLRLRVLAYARPLPLD